MTFTHREIGRDYDSHLSRTLNNGVWDLKHALELRSIVDEIQDEKNRACISTILDDFEEKFYKNINNFRCSVAHNDGNDWNIIVSTDNQFSIGLIDFLDAVHTCTIFNLAIMLAYAMQSHKKPLRVARAVIKGYHLANPLFHEEISGSLFSFLFSCLLLFTSVLMIPLLTHFIVVLLYLIRTRLAVSVTSSARNQRLFPENKAYYQVNEKPGWDLLHQLDSLDNKSATALFQDACKVSL